MCSWRSARCRALPRVEIFPSLIPCLANDGSREQRGTGWAEVGTHGATPPAQAKHSLGYGGHLSDLDPKRREIWSEPIKHHDPVHNRGHDPVGGEAGNELHRVATNHDHGLVLALRGPDHRDPGLRKPRSPPHTTTTTTTTTKARHQPASTDQPPRHD